MRTLHYSHKSSRPVRLFDYMFVRSVLSAAMTEAGCFFRYSITLVQIVSDFTGQRFDISQRLWQQCSKIDRQAHLASERELVRCEAGRFRDCRPVCLQHWRQQGFLVIRSFLNSSTQHRHQSPVEFLAYSVCLKPVR